MRCLHPSQGSSKKGSRLESRNPEATGRSTVSSERMDGGLMEPAVVGVDFELDVLCKLRCARSDALFEPPRQAPGNGKAPS
mmetsp:Transcript_41972/g.100021  ORF Transcript_41972/g.100021 Transcript_41972/m.100021 type:complete len:81 (+) Transcript_41972:319-561(+)